MRPLCAGLAALMLVALGCIGTADAQDAYTVNHAAIVDPATAHTWYCAAATGCTASGTRNLWTSNYPLEITQLANALHNNVDLIYEYVRNNIEIVPMYGLQKGALGALIDRSGTAFDQAALMVELLRTSGYTASFVDGTVTLTGAQAQAWLGTSDAGSLSLILGDGGIPGNVTPATGTATSVTLAHAWVQVVISGTTYQFDPSYKPHTFTAPINFATATGYNDATFIGQAQAGMTSGTVSVPSDLNTSVNVNIPYVGSINQPNLQTTLTQYATNLQNYLRTNGYATKQIEDVVGRQDIQLSTGTLRLTSPGSNYSQTQVWTGNIPDAYRVKERVELLQLNTPFAVLMTQDLFADEIYGRRVYYDTYVTASAYTNETFQLMVDGLAVGPLYTGTDPPTNRRFRLRLSIDHPYVANSGTYMDYWGSTAIVKFVDMISPVQIVTGLGDVSSRLQDKLTSEQLHDKLLPSTTYYVCSGGSGTTGCETTLKPDQPNGETTLARAQAGWLAEYSRMAMLQSRMIGGLHQQHHSLGIAYKRSFVGWPNESACSTCYGVIQSATVLDVDTAVSVNSLSGNAAGRTTLAKSLAASADMLEGSIFEQVAQAGDPGSVAHRFMWGTHNNAAMNYYLVGYGANSQNLYPAGVDPYSYLSIYSAVAAYTTPAANYSVIVAANEFLGPGRDCNPTPCMLGASATLQLFERGGAFVAHAPDGVSTAYVITDNTASPFKGGSAAAPPTFDSGAPDIGADILKDQFKDRSKDFGIDLATGDFTYSAPEDLSVGQGAFPYKLSFKRTFKSGSSHSPGMGLGWSHNLDIRVDVGTDGMASLGKSSVLAAAPALTALYATQQIYGTQPPTPTALLGRWVLAPLTQGWWALQMRHNTVTHTEGSVTKSFVRLADGTFNPPDGYNPGDGSSYWKLQQLYPEAFYDVVSTTPVVGSVAFTLTSPAQDVQSFTFWDMKNTDTTQPYSFGPHHGYYLTSWSYPQGISLTFTYVPSSNVNSLDAQLATVSNNLGRQLSLTFAADTNWEDCAFQSASDGQGHSATYNCATATYLSPVGDQSSYTYGAINCGNGVWPSRTTRPWCSPLLQSLYEPSDLSTPKLTLAYDATWKTVKYSDAVTIKTPAARNPYNFFITGGTRGERQDPSGNFYTVYYDPWTRATQSIDELGRTTTATYDGLARVLTRKTPGGILDTFAYAPRGGVSSLVRTPSTAMTPATLTASATYDTACGGIKTLTDANGNQRSWNYSPTTCLISSAVLPAVPDAKNGGVMTAPTTSFTYTSVGLIQTHTDPTGVVRKFSYDASGNIQTIQLDPTGVNQSTSYGADAVGNLTSVTTGRGNQTLYAYDAARRVTQMTGPAATCLITQNRWSGGLLAAVWNRLDCNAAATTVGTSQVWAKTYTPTDKIFVETDPNGNTTETDYDPLDRAQYVKRSIGNGQPTRVDYTVFDAAGQTFQQYRAYGTADQIKYAEFTYTADGLVSTTKDANGNVTTAGYDGYDRATSMTFPDTSYVSYGLDNNGNHLTQRNRSGNTLTMSYDALNREYSRVVPANVNGNYARTLLTAYDLASRKIGVTADVQTLTHQYDTGGRLTGITDSLINALATNAGNVAYGYDASGNRGTLTFTFGGAPWTLTYGYDAGERLSALSNGSTYGSFLYDNLGRSSTTTYLDGSTVGYQYEADGDLQTLTHAFNGGSNALGYTHNGAHQILTMSTGDATYLMKQPKVATTYTVNNLNQYTAVGGTTPTYDGNGNLTSDGTFTYQFDEENRLRQAVGAGTTAVYGYDPLGRRRSKTVNSVATYFVNDGPNELLELNSSGANQRLYLNALDMDSRVGVYDTVGGAGWLFFHRNHQGSVLFTTQYTGVAGTNGLLHDQYAYGVYGEAATTAPLTGNPVRYTGRYLDAETGLYYYRARYYSPTIGRFLQTDPIGTKDDLDLYTYVGNDPLDRTDPSGNCPSCLIGALVEVGFEAYTGELNNAFSQAFEGNYGALAVSAGKIGIAAASGGVSTVVGAKAVGAAVKVAEALNAGKAATTAAQVAATAASQAATSAATKVATNEVEGKPLGEGVGVAAAAGATIGTAGKIAGDKLSQAASGLGGALGANAKTAVNAAAKVVTGEVKKETQCTVKNNGNAC